MLDEKSLNLQELENITGAGVKEVILEEGKEIIDQAKKELEEAIFRGDSLAQAPTGPVPSQLKINHN